MALTKAIYLRELGPREGFQTLKREPVPTAVKLRLIQLLSQTGVPEIEITSLVNPKHVPQMADADHLVASFERRAGVRYTALYLNQKGFERGEALGRLDNEGWILSATSETFLKKNSNTSREHIVKEVPAWLSLFARFNKPLHGVMISTAFGCGYEGKDAAKNLLPVLSELMNAIRDAGGAPPKEISLADTVGMGTPEAVKRAVASVKAQYPEVTVSLHLHDTMGMAIANAYAGLCEGVSTFDASVGGLGGCPFTPGASGNIASEELMYLCEELGIATNVNLDGYVEAGKFIETELGLRLPSRLLRARVA